MNAGLHRAAWLLVLCGITGLAWAGTPLPDGPHIVVTAEGKTSAVPDQARVTFEFQSRAAQPLPTKQAVDQGVNRLLSRLGEFGIADQDIQASDLSTSEDVDYTDEGKRIFRGYESRRSVTVLIKKIQALNDLIDAGLAEGAHGFSQLTFDSSQATALRLQAKQKAIENLRTKASETAASFGAELGPIYSIDSVNSRQSFGYSAGTLDAVSVTGGRRSQGRYLQPTVEYTENASAVFELKR